MPPIRFNRPPVVEVVCGVMFDAQKLQFRSPHVGLLWSRFQSDFPRVEEANPIDPAIERFGPAGGPIIELSSLPAMRRVWFLDKDGKHLIQIQEDRFLFNWKRINEGDQYPSYDMVIAAFERYLGVFSDFVSELKLGELSYRQYELTYVNHITAGNGLNQIGESRLLVDHAYRNTQSRFLPEPESFAWRASYSLPNASGRLHITARTANTSTDRERVVRLDLIARGIPEDKSEAQRRPWFDQAHDWITRAFVDATAPELHPIWERTS